MTSSTASLGRDQFAEFYEEWYPRALAAARKRGVDDPEAVAQDIMMVFFEKDYLDRYDPTRPDASRFDDWVISVVYKRLNNVYRDRSRKDEHFKLVPLVDNTENEFPMEDDIATPEFRLLAMRCFGIIQDRYGSDLAGIWVSVVKQVAEDTVGRKGVASPKKIREHLGLGRKVVEKGVAELRHVVTTDADLREMLGADSWALSTT